MFWVDVLNRALDWRDPELLQREPHAARPLSVLRPERRRALGRDVQLLRRVFAARYLDTALTGTQAEALNQWLTAVTLRVSAFPDDKRPYALQAQRRRLQQPEPFESLLSGALVQLLGMAHDPNAMAAVHRCHGVWSVASSADGDDFLDWPLEHAEDFARRAGIQRVLTADRRQCARLVVSERGSRYCSKACSNASFARRKSRDDPRYFAQKQERYRRRKQQSGRGAAAQLDRGAFVYME